VAFRGSKDCHTSLIPELSQARAECSVVQPGTRRTGFVSALEYFLVVYDLGDPSECFLSPSSLLR
jgi:hypothetical protein